METYALKETILSQKRASETARETVELRIIPFGSHEYFQCVLLREANLLSPLGKRFNGEMLKREEKAIHLGLWKDSSPICCALLYPKDSTTMIIQQLAWEPHTSSALISSLLKICETISTSFGCSQLSLYLFPHQNLPLDNLLWEPTRKTIIENDLLLFEYVRFLR